MSFDFSDAQTGDAHPSDDLAVVSASVEAIRAARAATGAAHAAEVRAMEAAYAVAERQIAAQVTRRGRDAEIAMRSIAAELAAAVRLSDRSMLGHMERAATLVRKFPGTLDALAAGRITRTHVDAVLRAGSPLVDDDSLAAFEAAILPRAEELTPARLEKYETRTLDQIRADVVCDLLFTADPTGEQPTGLAAITAIVQVSMPAATLSGESEGGGELAGGISVDATTARELAGAAPGWDRIFRDPTNGCVLRVDRYRPSEEQRRFLRARDEHCRFPGCRRSAVRCDIDHTIAAAEGGPTEIENLAHLCVGHHVLKHASTWTVRQLGGGVLQWTSPTGRTYIDRPQHW